MTSEITAVVVRWRGGDEVDRCLESLLRHGGQQLDRVVLVDSGSGDGGAERLAQAFPSVTVLALSENRSFAWAANQGCAMAETPLLLLLNPDTELLPGSLDELVSFLDGRPAAAGVVPLLVGRDGQPQHRWQLRRLPTTIRLATGRAGAPAFRAVPRQPVPVAQPAAAAWLLRRRVWQALGGFALQYQPAWWEDVDLCWRLARGLHDHDLPASEGWWLVPSAQVLHQGGSSLVNLAETEFLAMYYRNLLNYARRYRPWTATLISNGVYVSLLARAAGRPRRRRIYLAALRSLTSKGSLRSLTSKG